MKCLFVFALVVAVCSGVHLRIRRNPDWHPHHPQQQRYRLSASPRGAGGAGGPGSQCPPLPLPVREPIIIQQELPAPYNINFGAEPKIIEHNANPTQIDYYEKPTVINHQKEAVLNLYTQQPVVVDTFGAPTVDTKAGPNVITIEQVAADSGAGGSGGAGGAGAGGAGNTGDAGGAGSGAGFGNAVLHHRHHKSSVDQPGQLQIAPSPCAPPPCA